MNHDRLSTEVNVLWNVVVMSVSASTPAPDWTADSYQHLPLCPGDFNGDGYDDLVLGARQPMVPSGSEFQYRLFLGGRRGLSSSFQVVFEAESDYYGGWMDPCLALDANGDGIDDLFVSRRESESCYYGGDEAFMELKLGSPTGFTTAWSLQEDYATVLEAQRADFDGDGQHDLTLGLWKGQGDPCDFKGTPRVVALDGPAPTVMFSMVPDGYPYAVGADLDADGYDELVVGTAKPGTAGKIEIFSSGPSGPAPTPTQTIFGTSPADPLGFLRLGGGDLDGDGYADVVASSTATNDISVLRGGPGPWGPPSVFGTVPYEPVGWAWMRDRDHDGDAELVVGLPGRAPGGAAAVLDGGPGLVAPGPGFKMRGDPDHYDCGQKVASGDFNRDGVRDWVVNCEGSTVAYY